MRVLTSVRRYGNFAYEGEPRFHGRAVLGPAVREARRIDNPGGNYSSLASVSFTSSPACVPSTV